MVAHLASLCSIYFPFSLATLLRTSFSFHRAALFPPARECPQYAAITEKSTVSSRYRTGVRPLEVMTKLCRDGSLSGSLVPFRGSSFFPSFILFTSSHSWTSTRAAYELSLRSYRVDLNQTFRYGMVVAERSDLPCRGNCVIFTFSSFYFLLYVV